MVADADLPVWTLNPTWGDGIRERLEWLTDVLKSSYGTEQCRALRLSPRRSFEATFHPLDQERAFFDLWLHRFGSQEFMVPLWHDVGLLTAGASAGDTVVALDTADHEFAAGELALLVGEDPFTFDKVEITDVLPNSIAFADPLANSWSTGSAIYPLRRTRLEDESKVAALTDRVAKATLRFELNQANDLDDEGAWDLTYGDYPLLTTEPNRAGQLDLSFQRNSLLLDNDQGLRALADDAGRAFTVQVHKHLLGTKAELKTLRQMLYRLRGQQGAVWLPTFNRDVELSRAAASADARLDIKKIGYAYTGGLVDGRAHLLLNGNTPVEISGTAAALSAGEERLTLAAGVGVDLPAGTFGSFMDTHRLATDEIEIQHHTNGVSECQISFRAFRDARTTPAVLTYPIPATAESDAACGAPAPEEADCYHAPESGFWVEMNFDYTYDDPLLPISTAGINLSFYDADDNLLANASSFSHGNTFTSSTDGLGHVTGQTFRMLTSVYPVNPFADQPGGRPAKITLQIQFGAFQVPNRPGGLHTRAFARWRLPEESDVTLYPTPHDAERLDLFQIMSLWPVNVVFNF